MTVGYQKRLTSDIHTESVQNPGSSASKENALIDKNSGTSASENITGDTKANLLKIDHAPLSPKNLASLHSSTKSNTGINQIGPTMTAVLKRISLVDLCTFQQNIPLSHVCVSMLECLSPYMHEYMLFTYFNGETPTFFNSITSAYERLCNVSSSSTGLISEKIENTRRMLVRSNEWCDQNEALLLQSNLNLCNRLSTSEDFVQSSLVFLEELMKICTATLQAKAEFLHSVAPESSFLGVETQILTDSANSDVSFDSDFEDSEGHLP